MRTAVDANALSLTAEKGGGKGGEREKAVETTTVEGCVLRTTAKDSRITTREEQQRERENGETALKGQGREKEGARTVHGACTTVENGGFGVDKWG